MADKSNIEWTDATWNPIRSRGPDGKLGWHCEHVTEACRFCYAEKMNVNRYYGNGIEYKPGVVSQIEIFLDEKMLLAPLRWRKARKIFVCSMTDLYGSWVKDEWLDRIYAVMALCPQHTFIVLTKRPERMREYCGERHSRNEVELAAEHIKPSKGFPVSPKWCLGWPLPNVWAGTSCSTQEDADKFIPEVLATPLAKRIVSLEPLLGPIDLEPWLAWPDGAPDVGEKSWGCQECDSACDCPKGNAVFIEREGPPDSEGAPSWITVDRQTLDWVIVGGESGKNARPMHPDWARSLRDQCKAAGVRFFFKQWGEFQPNVARGGVFYEKDFGALLCADTVGRRFHALPSEMEPLEDGGFVCTFDMLERVGKKRAGRLLDGHEWNEFPVPSVIDDPVNVRSPIVTQNNEGSTK